jgi:hypothetical protein
MFRKLFIKHIGSVTSFCPQLRGLRKRKNAKTNNNKTVTIANVAVLTTNDSAASFNSSDTNPFTLLTE